MYTDFEQDLILACKFWYGENGIDKVIADAIGYGEEQEVSIHSKYHFISQLYLKLIENKHLFLYNLIDRFKPSKFHDVCNHDGMYDVMRSEISGLRVKNEDKTIIELHTANEKYREE
jgi:hypothetical protein